MHRVAGKMHRVAGWMHRVAVGYKRSLSYPSPHSADALVPPVQLEMGKQRWSCVELGSRHQSGSSGSVEIDTPSSVQLVPAASQGSQLPPSLK